MADRLTPKDKGLLLARIRKAWDELQAIVQLLDEQRLTAVPPDGDWSVKDHLAHLAVWLKVAAARAEGTPDNMPFALNEEAFRAADMDGMNDAAYRLNKDRSAADVLVDLQSAHTSIIAIIERLTEAELAAPPRTVRPHRSTLMDNIAGNTYEHYEEHIGYIRLILARLK